MAWNAATTGAIIQDRHDFHERSVQPVDPFNGRSHRVQHLLKREPLGGMDEALSVQPAQMSPLPSRASFVDTAMPEQERADVLALATVILDRHCPGTHQIANRLVRLVRYPDRRQLRRTQQPGQRQCVAPVGLHPLARSTRDQRWRNHRAAMSHRKDLSVQTTARRSVFVAKVQRLVAVSELAHQLGNAIRCIGKLAEIPNLSLPTGLGDRNRVLRLGGIDPDKYFPTSPHGSSPVR
jgi:hypothetical protein